MAMAARMLVNTNSGVTLRAVLCCFSLGGGITKCLSASTGEAPAGLDQRVARKTESNAAWTASRASEKGRDRNVVSPTKRQLTVHLNKNCRESSKARDR